MNTHKIALFALLIPLSGCMPSAEKQPTHHHYQNLDDVTETVITSIQRNTLKDFLQEQDTQQIATITKNFSPAEIAFEATVLNCPTPVAVYFFDTSAPDYKENLQLFDNYAHRFQDQVKFVTADVGILSRIMEKAEIDQVPTWMFIKDRNEIARIEGTITKEELDENIANLLAEEDND